MHLDCKMWTCDTSFETLVACEAHDLWRRQRKFKASVKTHGDTTVDTAACEFLDLPSYFKFDTLMGAHSVCEAVRDAWRKTVMLDKQTAKEMHLPWESKLEARAQRL